MLRTILKSKIHKAVVTKTNLHYEGSITIDYRLMQAADIREFEKVEVLNLNNGSRLETYAIKGRPGSGVISLNGAAARGAWVGDEVIILAYFMILEDELGRVKPKIIKPDGKNRLGTQWARRSGPSGPTRRKGQPS